MQQDRKPINVMFGITDIDLERVLFAGLDDELDSFTAAAEDEDNWVTVSVGVESNREAPAYPACPVCGQTAYWQRRKPRSKTDLSAFAAGVRSIGPIKPAGDRYPRALQWVCDCGNHFTTDVRPFGNWIVILRKQGHTTIDAPSDWEPRRAS